jgi:LacI family transcriptional regulator
VAQALAESGRRPVVNRICYDSMDGVVDAIKRDIVDVTIGQNEYLQGYLPVKLMYEYLTFGRQPPTEKIFTDIDIRVKENIDYRSNNPDSTYGPDRVLFL